MRNAKGNAFITLCRYDRFPAHLEVVKISYCYRVPCACANLRTWRRPTVRGFVNKIYCGPCKVWMSLNAFWMPVKLFTLNKLLKHPQKCFFNIYLLVNNEPFVFFIYFLFCIWSRWCGLRSWKLREKALEIAWVQLNLETVNPVWHLRKISSQVNTCNFWFRTLHAHCSRVKVTFLGQVCNSCYLSHQRANWFIWR